MQPLNFFLLSPSHSFKTFFPSHILFVGFPFPSLPGPFLLPRKKWWEIDGPKICSWLSATRQLWKLKVLGHASSFFFCIKYHLFHRFMANFGVCVLMCPLIFVKLVIHTGILLVGLTFVSNYSCLERKTQLNCYHHIIRVRFLMLVREYCICNIKSRTFGHGYVFKQNLTEGETYLLWVNFF